MAFFSVESAAYITADQSSYLLAFDYAICLMQSRLPIILAALALVRHIFSGEGTQCYPPLEYVKGRDREVGEYFNSYCIYEENKSLIGYHEFIPFTFTLQAVLTQIPVILWIAGGGKKISTVAKWFSKCCREMCSEAEASHQTENKVITSNKDWPKVHSVIHSYINEWSASNKYVVNYFILQVLLWMLISVSFVYHYLLLVQTIEPNFFNYNFQCEIKQWNKKIHCTKPYEIFNEILIIIDLLLCLTIPLFCLFVRDIWLFISIMKGSNDNITKFIPFLKIPEKHKRLNNMHLLTLYYKENIDLDDKYVQKILIPWLSQQINESQSVVECTENTGSENTNEFEKANTSSYKNPTTPIPQTKT